MTLRPIEIDTKDLRVPDDQPAPRLDWVKITDLVLDDSYQRPLGSANWAAIRRIAANFRWSKFSAVLCAPLPGGALAVVDGQHRCHAAAMCGFETVPALITPMSHGEQALGFAGVNGDTIRMSQFHLYKAALAGGVDWAVRAERACDLAGCRLMTFCKTSKDKKAGEIFSISLVRRYVDKGLDAELTRALKLLRHTDGDNRDLWVWQIIKAWTEFTIAQPALTDDAATAFLQQVDLLRLLDHVDLLRKKPDFAGIPRVSLLIKSIGALWNQKAGGRAA